MNTNRSLLVALTLILAGGCASNPDKSAKEPAPGPSADSQQQEYPAASDKKTEAPPPAEAKAKVPSNPAPEFSLASTDGKQVALADFRGKTVVLEWFNPGCPFVKYAHGKGPLKDQAAKTTSDGVVWLVVNSGAAGKQGAGAKASQAAAKDWNMQTPILIDDAGTVGRAYGAKTTPHMFVIDPDGELVYKGALDNAPMGKVDGGGAYVNYVEAALADLKAGRAVATAETTAYGCGVKYAN